MSRPSAIVVGVGAERGVGAALCRRFAQGGYHILVAGRTAAKIEKVAETIVSGGGSAEPIATIPPFPGSNPGAPASHRDLFIGISCADRSVDNSGG